MSAYQGTNVNWMVSQAAIVKMLTGRGIFSTRFTNMKEVFALEFSAELPGRDRPVGVRIMVPISHFSKEQEKERQRELNILHRVLFYHLKAKFVAIDNGLTEFMEEFMPHLIISDKNGNSSTIGQILLPQYSKAMESGHEFKLLPGTTNG
jgi:hypothetical protein